MANNKRAALYADAERLYVQDQLTLEAIAKKLGCSVRTLTSWKGEGNWEAKRIGFQDTSQSMHEELYELARLLTTKNLNKVREGSEPEKEQLSFVVKVMATLEKTRKYEAEVETPAADPEAAKREKLKDLKDRVNEMFGVNIDDDEDDDQDPS